MNNYFTTKFFECFFKLEAVFKFEDGGKDAFFKLAEIFGIPNAADLYKWCSLKEVREVDTLSKFNQHERIKAYRKANESYTAAMQEADEYVTIKGQALLELQELKLSGPEAISKAEIISRLVDEAGEGMVDAMWMYGFALLEGVWMPVNAYSGMQVLKKATRWNCPEACILAAYYDAVNAPSYISVFAAALSHTPYRGASAELANRYGAELKESLNAALLEKAVRRGLVKREKYDGVIARIIYCTGLSAADKREAVLTSGRGYLEEVAKLPLNIPEWGKLEFDFNGLRGRDRESQTVANLLKNARLCNKIKFRPVCIASGERYVLNFYSNAIKNAFLGCNVIEVDVAKTDASALGYDGHNVIIDGVEEKRNTVIIFRLEGEIPEGKLAVIRCFLNTVQRSAFRCYGLNLNLSNVLPVVLCDKLNLVAAEGECNVIVSAPLTDGEKQSAILEAIEENGAMFGVEGVTVEPAAMQKLFSLTADRAIDTLEKLFLSLQPGQNNLVTLNTLKQYLKEGAGVLGFGGD